MQLIRCQDSVLVPAARFALAAAVVVMFAGALPALAANEAPVSFTRQIAPILAENCFYCHGPDPSHREADLRLDLWEGDADDAMTAAAVIAPGDPESSELIARITADDADLKMPPAETGKSLTAEQIALVTEWIRQGARYEQHWAFVAPQRPAVPAVQRNDWVRNPIDAFVLARLAAEGLAPAPEAQPLTLLRRATLDVTGLPPTLAEIDEFAAASQADADRAYAELVDRLLASPHHAEHLARQWLDAARYADSDGYEKDRPRDVWMYRDWVVEALRRDMPYDEFLVRQIAGDLLPAATQADRVATGFLRNSMVNREGGIDPEQFRMEGMYDRMDAVGKSMLGLTVQCAQCHSHKYDPLSHTDYYRMFALLNNCHEAQIPTYSPAEQQQIAALERDVAAIEEELKRQTPDWQAQVAAWAERLATLQPAWTVLRPELDGSGGQKHYLLADGSVLAQGYDPPQLTATFAMDLPAGQFAALRLELFTDPNLPLGGPGRSAEGTCSLAEIRLAVAPPDAPEQKTDLKLAAAAADVNPPTTTLPRRPDDGEKPDRTTGPVASAIDGDELTAWSINIGPGRSNVPRQAVFTLAEPQKFDRPMRLFVTLAQRHGGRAIDSPLTQNIGRFRLSAGATAYPADAIFPLPLADAITAPAAERTPAQFAALFSAWRETQSAWSAANEQIEKLQAAHPRGSSQLVVQERTEPRETHRLERGNFLTPAEQVTGGVPSFLHPLTDAAPNRLSLARWLASRDSPLAARVEVNRIWQHYFGTGLVATPDDFGLQGDVPSHPALLDWLAVELMDHGWSRRHIHRLIVTSSAYRQDSRSTPALAARDPQNRLLARGPRGRLPAEGVQDAALAASGLLNRQLGGPPVFPPAPHFLFEQPASYEPKVWEVSPEPGRYRRGLYVFRFRSVPYPVLENFDAPAGNVACVRRPTSNTPMQALTLLNETLLTECAAALADEARTAAGDDQRRIANAFLRCTTRSPEAEEVATLVEFLNRQRQRFEVDEQAAQAIVAPLATEHTAEQSAAAPPAERAAWFALARVLLNLDETVSKN